jgi:hypothetical protein
MDFEAPNDGSFAWLNSGKYVARRVLNPAAKTLTMRVYDVSWRHGRGGLREQHPDPQAGRAFQVSPWDYRRLEPSEKQGNVVVTESVTLSAKPNRSERAREATETVIPITGGELSGRITGKVLFRRARLSEPPEPSRYRREILWQTSDGDIIIVRNAGLRRSRTNVRSADR